MRQADHTAQKLVYRAYRERAILAAGSGELASTEAGLRIYVEPQANVRMVEDGAFVDATIWVPRAALTVRPASASPARP
jgi:hypothetical protein